MTEDLLHYGIKRRSGRYPWGSGDDPQRSKDIISISDEMRAKGMSDSDIAKELGITTTILRQERSIASVRRREAWMDTIDSMTKRGETNVAIAEHLGTSEATVRNMKKNSDSIHKRRDENIRETLRDAIAENPYLDVGVGIERQLGISREKLRTIVRQMIDEEGYVEHRLYLDRLQDPSKQLTLSVLTKEPDLGVVLRNSDEIRTLEKWSEDGGHSTLGLKPIIPVDSKKVQVLFGDEGGTDKDGLIELRRGVDDLDMGNSRYAQVRIQVDDTHYLKGMAVYADDLPDGVDIRFNTNKPSTMNKMDTLKKLTDDPDNPFGATINRQKGALNIVNEEGKWLDWQSTWSSQFLSKQSPKLIQERLDETFKKLTKDYDELLTLTNPTVQKYLMDEYISGLDTKYTKLKAAGTAGTQNHVILPFNDIKPNEVYAPNFKNGDNVVLVRYPHGGVFEIAELTVNNKSKSARNIIQNAIDAIGIHPSVAPKLSGADFDGDTVLVIKNNDKKIKSSRSLKELKNFDPMEYQVKHDTITDKRKQHEMGMVSNLITDMTIKGAPQSDIARAVKHSMVVIDSEKHKLDYKQSAIDHSIKALQNKYQTHVNLDGKVSKGASTLISKTLGKEIMVDQITTKVLNPKTGRMNTIKTGGKSVRLIDTVDDAHLLSSGTAVESVYANYINKVRALQNTASKKSASIKQTTRKDGMAKVYEKEVKSLDTKLNTALLNAPRERQAQLQANKTFYSKVTKEMDKEQKTKLKTQAVNQARKQTNAKGRETKIDVTPKEWEAIQNGAVSKTKLNLVLRNANSDQLKQYALPKKQTKLSSPSATRAKSLLNRGYTYAEVAQQLGVSTSTVSSLVNETE